MTQVDLHPEDLFDGLREGTLAGDAHARLLSHCAHCEPCQFELRLIEGQQFAFEETSRATQLADAALRQLSWPPPAPALPKVRRVFGLRQQLAAAAALLVLGVGFGAAAMFTGLSSAVDALLGRESHTPTLRQLSSATQVAQQLVPSATTATDQAPAFDPARDVARDPARDPANDVTPAAALPPSAAESPDTTNAEAKQAAPRAGRGAKRVRTPGTRVRRKAVVAPLTAAGHTTRAFSEADAETALSLATQARSTGYEGEAVERYRHVIDRFPTTRAAGAAQVALGRLLYKELSQPGAALPLFEAYLARRGARELTEEAMYHRGMCLVALQRDVDASATFGRLLELFPSSMYAAQARAQLLRLRGP